MQRDVFLHASMLPRLAMFLTTLYEIVNGSPPSIVNLPNRCRFILQKCISTLETKQSSIIYERHNRRFLTFLYLILHEFCKCFDILGIGLLQVRMKKITKNSFKKTNPVIVIIQRQYYEKWRMFGRLHTHQLVVHENVLAANI